MKTKRRKAEYIIVNEDDGESCICGSFSLAKQIYNAWNSDSKIVGHPKAAQGGYAKRYLRIYRLGKRYV